MLEANSFIVVRRFGSPRSIRQYDLADDRGHHLGRAIERLGPLARFCRRLGFPARCFSSRIDFLEPPDDSLVFTLGTACFSDHVIVRDALGECIGAIRPVRDSLPIVDRFGQLLGELHRTSSAKGCSIATPERELAQLTWANRGGLRLDITEELAEQPVVKMLILASAVTADFGYLVPG